MQKENEAVFSYSLFTHRYAAGCNSIKEQLPLNGLEIGEYYILFQTAPK